MRLAHQVYEGEVVHKRLRPKLHSLRYRVFSFALDVDQIDALDKASWIFSRNRFNALSLYDSDYGPGDKTPVGEQVRAVLRNAGLDVPGGRIILLCYPRVFGYVFNPLSVYFAFAQSGELRALVYEVSNTFGERRSYVVAAGDGQGAVHAQTASKKMFVSPFASGKGRYDFRVTLPGKTLTVGVMFRDADGPLIRTHFRGNAHQLTDRAMLGLLLRYPFLTVKVIAAIHFEALKLWLKGVPLVRGHRSGRYSVSYGGIEGQG